MTNGRFGQFNDGFGDNMDDSDSSVYSKEAYATEYDNLNVELDKIKDIQIEDEQIEIPAFVDALTDDIEIEDNLDAIEAAKEEEFKLVNDEFYDEKLIEKLWQERTGLNHDTLCGAIETIVFMTDRPINIVKIRNLIDPDMPLKIIHEAIERLQNEYEQGHHGLRLLEVAEGYQFRTKASYSKYVQDIFKINSLVLTPTALEVLALIAYKQPLSKTMVDKIRGVDSSHLVRALMDKRLVKVVGRSEELGRPVLYGTTLEFLEVFNLRDLSELPPEYELEDMAASTQIGKISDIKTICTGDKEKFKFDDTEELDVLTEQIKIIESDTPFIKSLQVEEKRRTSEEGVVIKSAFELLEEFVNLTQVQNQNKVSVASQLFMESGDINIIKDLEAGPFNLPYSTEEFSVVEVETGEEYELSDSETETEYEFADDGVEVVEEEEVDLFATNSNESISDALDAAFSKLSGESDEFKLVEGNVTVEDLSHDLDLNEMKLDQKVEDLDAKTDLAISKGSELDLDLNFLKEDVVKIEDDRPSEKLSTNRNDGIDLGDWL